MGYNQPDEMANRFSGLKGRRTRYALSFGESSVLAARLALTENHWAVAETSERPFAPDVVSVSPAEPNVHSMSALARITGDALGEVGCQGAGLSLILSDLAMRAFAVPVEKRTKPREMLANVASRLPYASHEAVFDTWRGGSNWALVAAVRGAVLRQYESAVEAVGCRVSWVDGASLIRIPDWYREAKAERENGLRAEATSAPLQVHVQLYPGHYSLSVFRGGALTDIRVKLIAGEDGSRVINELTRLPAISGGSEYEQLTLYGVGAATLFEQLDEHELMKGRVRLGEDGHQAHLSSLMARLAGRVRRT